MQAAKEKLSNMTSAAKEHTKINKAKVEEKVEKATARTAEEKKVAEERRKAKEHDAKMKLHAEKAAHKAERVNKEHVHHHAPLAAIHSGAPLGGGAGTHGHHGPILHGSHVTPPGNTGSVAPITTGVTETAYPVTAAPPAEKYL